MHAAAPWKYLDNLSTDPSSCYCFLIESYSYSFPVFTEGSACCEFNHRLKRKNDASRIATLVDGWRITQHRKFCYDKQTTTGSLSKMISKDERLHYQKKLRPYFMTSVCILAGGGLLGAVAKSYAPHTSQYFDQNIAEFVGLFRALPKLELAAAIFLNNTIKALLVVVGGAALGILPVIFIFANGAAVGFVLYGSIQSRGLLTALLAILPHGIFELPAVLLATGMGLLLGRSSIKKLFGSGEAAIANELALALKFFVRIVVPLLVIAALVEAFVTSVLVTT
jgi:stage II sporulation protein M